jgi:hypothetical protein
LRHNRSTGGASGASLSDLLVPASVETKVISATIRYDVPAVRVAVLLDITRLKRVLERRVIVAVGVVIVKVNHLSSSGFSWMLPMTSARRP